ncbi:MAG: carboxylating nicotinate-nucleotide diphosphorylase [Pirellulales bacterium]
MTKEFQQISWNESVANDWRQLLRLAIPEDLGPGHDWTTESLVPESLPGRATLVARLQGIVAGLPAARLTLTELAPGVRWLPAIEDGTAVKPGDRIALLEGPARSLLTCERLLLNVVGRLSGIATLTRRYVDAVTGTSARIFDTRKTTPGWRLLEKYAVGRGGGWNHRTGLFDAILIKDNHLAVQGLAGHGAGNTPAQAVAQTRRFLSERAAMEPDFDPIVEVEVDTLEQLGDVLPACPDIILLDNMNPAQLRQAVAMRDRSNPAIQLEASGGIQLETVVEIARAGVDRISVGALTHSAVSLDIALDWLAPEGTAAG